MKKLFASMTAIALVGAMALPVTAFADTTITPGSSENNGRNVSFTSPAESWTITIPSTVQEGLVADTNYTITASDVSIDAGTRLYVVATSTNGASRQNNWTAVNTANSNDFVNYTVSKYVVEDSPVAVQSGQAIAVFSHDDEAQFQVQSPNFEGNYLHNATYTDTITFTVTKTDPSSQTP